MTAGGGLIERRTTSAEAIRKALGPTADHALLPYMPGTGVLTAGGQKASVAWALAIGADGRPRIWVETREFFHPDEGDRVKLEGTTEDGGVVVVELVTEKHHLAADATSTSIDFTFRIRNSFSIWWGPPTFPDHADVKSHLLNFRFFGDEWVQFDARDNMRHQAPVLVTLGGIPAFLDLTPNHKAMEELVDAGRLDGGCFSTVGVDGLTGFTTERLLDWLANVGWAATLASGQLSHAVLTSVRTKDGDMRMLHVADPSRRPSHKMAVIDNFLDQGSLSKALPKLFEAVVTDHGPVNFRKVGSLLSEIHSQKYLETRFAVLIMAYEMLLSQYLVSIGEITAEQLLDPNMTIQSKLGKLNKHLHFIPKELLGDDLRKVRNPLLHQGLLGFDVKDALGQFKRYHNLLLRIVLRLAGVTGKYRNPWASELADI